MKSPLPVSWPVLGVALALGACTIVVASAYDAQPGLAAKLAAVMVAAVLAWGYLRERG